MPLLFVLDVTGKIEYNRIGKKYSDERSIEIEINLF